MFSAQSVSVGAQAAEDHKPGFVSIDFCADQYVLALADRSEIQAVSFEAAGPRSFFATRAQGVPTVKGNMEEILLARPALVLRTWRGGARAGEIMEKAGVPSYQPAFAFGIEANIRAFETVGQRLGKAEVARQYVKTRLEKLSALKAEPKSALRAVYMTPSGFTAGLGTFVDDIIKIAGFDTVAGEYGVQYWAPLPLEKLVLNPPDFAVATFFGDHDVHVSQWDSGRHSLFLGLLETLPVVHIPSRYLSCSGAFAVEAATFIRGEAIKLGLMDEELLSR